MLKFLRVRSRQLRRRSHRQRRRPADNDDDESVEFSDGLFYDSHDDDDDDDDSYIKISAPAPVPVVAPAPGPVEALKRKRTVPLRFKDYEPVIVSKWQPRTCWPPMTNRRKT